MEWPCSSISRGLIKYRFCGPISDPRVEQLALSDEGQALQGPGTQEVFLLCSQFWVSPSSTSDLRGWPGRLPRSLHLSLCS